MWGRIAACERLIAGGAISAALALSPVAASAWDLAGSVGVQQMWDENATVSSQTASARRWTYGDAVSSLRLSGRAVYTGPRTSFTCQYDPIALFHRDRAHLNRVSHFAQAHMRWDASPRGTLQLSERFSFTPEQGLNSTVVAMPSFLTRFSDRRTNEADMGYRHRFSERSDLLLEMRHYVRSFSDPRLVDSSGTVPAIRYNHRVGAGTAVEVGTSRGWHRFESPRRGLALVCSPVRPEDPCLPEFVSHRLSVHYRTTMQTVFAGAQQRLGERAAGTFRLGWTTIDFDDPTSSGRRTQHIYAGIQWRGTRAQVWGGVNRDVSTQSGISSHLRTDTAHLNTAVPLGTALTAVILANYTRSRGLGAFNYRVADTFNGQATLTYRLSRTLNAHATYARQNQNASSGQLPQLAFNRYAVGITALFN